MHTKIGFLFEWKQDVGPAKHKCKTKGVPLNIYEDVFMCKKIDCRIQKSAKYITDKNVEVGGITLAWLESWEEVGFARFGQKLEWVLHTINLWLEMVTMAMIEFVFLVRISHHSIHGWRCWSRQWILSKSAALRRAAAWIPVENWILTTAPPLPPPLPKPTSVFGKSLQRWSTHNHHQLFLIFVDSERWRHQYP